MNNAKQFIKDKGIVPFISFKETPVHTVKLISDEQFTMTDKSGEVVEGVKFMVEERGEPKSFFTSSIGLIQKLGEIPEGSLVKIAMKSRKGNDGNFQSYYEVDNLSIGDGEVNPDDVPNKSYEE